MISDPLNYLLIDVCYRTFGVGVTVLGLVSLAAITVGLMGWRRSKRDAAARAVQLEEVTT